MLELAVARGELEKPFRKNLHAEIIQKKGDEHEERYLDGLRAEGKSIVEPETAADTEAAIRARAGDVVYQARLEHDGWRGIADFVELQPDGFYEVVDTKLARRAKPQHVLQLSYYTEQVARIQGHAPEAMHVVNGLGERETFRPSDFAAYYRRLRRRFLEAVEEGRATYPYPVDFCGLCNFLSLCKARWDEDDHLTLVAGISRMQVERLEREGITTLELLAEAVPETRVRGMRPATFEGIRHQAELQLHRRRTGEHRFDLLAQEEERGFALMPSRATAISGSTTRATLGSNQRTGSST